MKCMCLNVDAAKGESSVSIAGTYQKAPVN